MRPLTAALVAAFLCLAPAPSHAQRTPCGDGDSLIAHLEKEWGEAPAVIALDAAGRLVRILINPQTGTWSLLMTGPGGPTCMVNHGSAWESVGPAGSPGERL